MRISQTVFRPNTRVAITLSSLAVIAAALASAALLFMDTYSTSTCDQSGCIEGSKTLVEVNGSWVLALLAIPLVLTVATFAAIVAQGPRAFEWGASVVFLLACLIAIASVGFAFLPSAALLLAAVATNKRVPLPPEQDVST